MSSLHLPQRPFISFFLKKYISHLHTVKVLQMCDLISVLLFDS